MNNNEIALNIIKNSQKSLTAYEILDKFQKIKKVQPMTVYCTKCGDSQELHSDLFSSILQKTRLKKYEFLLFDLEISTVCRSCS